MYKAHLEKVLPAGKFNADKRPPLNMRFDEGMPNIRKTSFRSADPFPGFPPCVPDCGARIPPFPHSQKPAMPQTSGRDTTSARENVEEG